MQLKAIDLSRTWRNQIGCEMPDFKDANNWRMIVAFLVPGIITLWTRAQFLTGRSKSHTDMLLGYVTISLVYYALTIPFAPDLLRPFDSWKATALVWTAFCLVGPFIFGLVLGASAQFQIVRGLVQRIGLRPIHHIPTAWDYCFSNVEAGGCYVRVTLIDDSFVSGFFADHSFASSDETCRDLFIEEIWDEQDGVWTPRAECTGIYLPASTIRHVQFWSLKK